MMAHQFILRPQRRRHTLRLATMAEVAIGLRWTPLVLMAIAVGFGLLVCHADWLLPESWLVRFIAFWLPLSMSFWPYSEPERAVRMSASSLMSATKSAALWTTLGLAVWAAVVNS